MFDDFRQPAAEADQENDFDVEEAPQLSGGNFLGLTPPQRFVIAVLFLMMTCLMGISFLFLTGSIEPF